MKLAQFRRLTMIDNGEAYIMILPHMHTIPTTKVRLLVEWARVRTKAARTATNITSRSRISSTLSLCFLSDEQKRKRITYTAAITVPVPFMVTTKMLLGCTIGSPYKTQTIQLIRVAKYGAGENCSTDPFFHI